MKSNGFVLVFTGLFSSAFAIELAESCRTMSAGIYRSSVAENRRGPQRHLMTADGTVTADKFASKSVHIHVREHGSTVTELDPESVQQLFSYQFAPEKFGAKGVALRAPDGKVHILLWDQGKGSTGNNIHHRDALAYLLRRDSAVLDRYARQLDHHGREEDAKNSLERALVELDSAASIETLRNLASFPDELLKNSLGVQLSGHYENGKFILDHIDLDSSITSAQIARETPVDADFVEQTLQGIYQTFPKSMTERTHFGTLWRGQATEMRTEPLQSHSMHTDRPVKTPRGTKLEPILRAQN